MENSISYQSITTMYGYYHISDAKGTIIKVGDGVGSGMRTITEHVRFDEVAEKIYRIKKFAPETEHQAKILQVALKGLEGMTTAQPNG